MRCSKLVDRRPIPRLGLSRTELAVAIGVSTGSVDQMVSEGVLPPPRRWHSRKIWLVAEVEAYLNESGVERRWSIRRIVSCGESSESLPPRRKKSRIAASSSVKRFHASGRRLWILVSMPMSLRGRLAAEVESSGCRAVWVVKPSKFAAPTPAGKSVLLRATRERMSAWLGRVGPIPGHAGQCLDHGGQGLIAKIVQAPDTLAT